MWTIVAPLNLRRMVTEAADSRLFKFCEITKFELCYRFFSKFKTLSLLLICCIILVFLVLDFDCIDASRFFIIFHIIGPQFNESKFLCFCIGTKCRLTGHIFLTLR